RPAARLGRLAPGARALAAAHPRTARAGRDRCGPRQPARIHAAPSAGGRARRPAPPARRMTLDTLAAPARHAIDVKHSRFLAQASPVASAGEAAAFLREVSVPDATHNCWAWRLGGDYRSSDDGEPAGTAGRPILAAIDGQGF